MAAYAEEKTGVIAPLADIREKQMLVSKAGQRSQLTVDLDTNTRQQNRHKYHEYPRQRKRQLC